MRFPLLLFTALGSLATEAQTTCIDQTFLADVPSVQVLKVVELPDGKVLMGGTFTNYAGSSYDHLVRLNADGSLDYTFNSGHEGPQNSVYDIDVMPDGRILICGNFLQYNGVNSYFVARLHADGTLDPTFNIPPNSINGAVNAVAWHEENKVVAAGDFFECYGHSKPHIVRFNSSGTVDTTFQIGTGFTTNVYDLEVLPNMQILVAGAFFQYNGNSCGRLALLNTDGTYDPSMSNSPGFNGIARHIEVQTDGKILVGGSFDQHNGQDSWGLARLDPDGSADPAFTSPFYPYAPIFAIAVQADGKIVVGGEWTENMYAVGVGPGTPRLTRLLPDGTRDATFAIGAGPGDLGTETFYIRDVAVLSTGKILVAGRFTKFDSEIQYQQIIRLNENLNVGVTDIAPAADIDAIMDRNNDRIRLTTPEQLRGTFQLVNAAGQVVSEGAVSNRTTYISTASVSQGVHVLRVQTSDGALHSVKLVL
ncbi:MAG: hypothetical protein IPH05_06225 [Flavobacteriales bacterium]|nr:hypothetical protein [Flavobacteriales bacterium]MBK6882531.1 hypothetical protein [Flavobacteriales bacterium]